MRVQLLKRLYRGEFNSIWETSDNSFHILPTEEYDDSSWGKKYEKKFLGVAYQSLSKAWVNLVFVEKDALENALKDDEKAAKEEQQLIEAEYNME